MNLHNKKIIVIVSTLAVLVSACDIEPQEGIAQTGILGTEPLSDVHSQPGSISAPKDTGGFIDQVVTVDSIQIAPISPVTAELLGDVKPEDIPSPEELSAVLEQVNRGGPERPGSDETIGEGPKPGTESEIGPVNASSILEPKDIPGGTVNPEESDSAVSDESIQVATIPPVPAEPFGDVKPEDIPSPEELSAVLEQVNRGGPKRSGSDEIVSKGPKPGTESTMSTENTSNTEGNVIFLQWKQFFESLRNWLQEVLDL